MLASFLSSDSFSGSRRLSHQEYERRMSASEGSLAVEWPSLR